MRKALKKWVYGRCPGLAGAFPYFGVKVHFPPDSLSFHAACDQGIFERSNVVTLQRLARPDTTVFDIGANIGLMAIPVLQSCKTCRVVSVEPSPNAVSFLRRTIAGSGFGSRWLLIEKAVGARIGRSDFAVSPEKESLYDGLKATHRASSSQTVEVEITTVDSIWNELGRPAVSIVKCDVEGGELDVFAGASECLATTKAAILTEWNAANFVAYERKQEELLEFATRHGYRLFAVPGFAPITDEVALSLHMIETESFLLIK
ncbi:MAG TPA: FkbM family methyltransferase [Chthoniobacterales bacterium]|nr:FkbM family methyltransferase [Chthoniobacterales bacterium]